MEAKKWDFGTFMPTVTIKDGVMSIKVFSGVSPSYPLDAVQGVQYQTELLKGGMVVLASGGDNKPIIVHKNDKARQIVGEINAYIQAWRQAKQPKPTTPAQAPSVADELSKLAALKAQGVLTEEEFSSLKQKLLLG